MKTSEIIVLSALAILVAAGLGVALGLFLGWRKKSTRGLYYGISSDEAVDPEPTSEPTPEPIPTPELKRYTAIWARGRDDSVFRVDYEGVDCVMAWGKIEPEVQEFVQSQPNTDFVPMTGDPGIPSFSNQTLMELKVMEQADWVDRENYDGINFDLESHFYTEEENDNWVLYLKKLREEFNNRGWQNKKITIASPWSPAAIKCLDGRCYHAKDLSEVVDYMIIMMYDAEEDWWNGNHYGHSTDPYYRAYQGLREYIDCLDIPPHKFIYGVPWYSHEVKCKIEDDGLTPETREPDRKYQCSREEFYDFNGDYDEQVSFGTAYEKFLDYKHRRDSMGNDLSEGAENVDSLFYSDVEEAYFFHYEKTGEEDPNFNGLWEYWTNAIPGNYTALEMRYQLAVDAGVSGLGLWHVRKLPYSAYGFQTC